MDPPPRGPTPLSVALVDDHPVFRIGLARILNRRPETSVVWEAGSLEETLTCLERATPDLLLMDVHLGSGADGLETTRRVLERAPSVKVVILSAILTDAVVDQARAAGAAGYLAKDLLPDELVRRLLQVALADRVRGPGTDRRFSRQETESLTARESQVMAQIQAGRTNGEIAHRLGISRPTVDKHVRNILRKLNARNRAHAAHIYMTGEA